MKLSCWASVPITSGLHLKEYVCKLGVFFINFHSLLVSMKFLVKEELSGSQSVTVKCDDVVGAGWPSPQGTGTTEGLSRFLKSKNLHIPICYECFKILFIYI